MAAGAAGLPLLRETAVHASFAGMTQIRFKGLAAVPQSQPDVWLPCINDSPRCGSSKTRLYAQFRLMRQTPSQARTASA